MSKKAIEYNGSKFHPSPSLDDNIGWCVFHPNLTAKSARDKEQRKFQALKERGFEILVVWDKEYKENPEAILKKCIDFLTQENQLSMPSAFHALSFPR